MNDANSYDVLILGYGPAGATLANLLGQRGHRVAVAEMHAAIFDKPRAINLDQEALRLFQRIDVAAKIADGRAMHPGTDFLGADGLLIKSIRSAPPPYPLGWPANVMFVQPEAESILRSRAASFENIDVFLEHTAVSLNQTEDAVTVHFETPTGATSLRAKYVVGCDGANSPTRHWIAATQTDLGFSEHWVVVDAWLTRETPLPERTTQYCDPRGPTSFVKCSENLRRWEMKILPGENIDDYNDLERIKDRLGPFVDVTALKFWRSSVYHFNARVADKWREGRVFLAGDAAHTMPPFLGQGLNSGLRDIANLFWKMSFVLSGAADESLLDTYQVERRPHIL
ncbi:MAG: bifunctional 3-(3-hydroxy-phenyl)propionate/3-hydroxycinnamic acid hydroxylase, partial [Pseudomonadota bacterium]